MKFIAAYLLSNLSGEQVTSAKINAILSSVGIESDDAKVETLLASLAGKDLAEVIAEGNSKLASVPSGGAAVASSGAAGKTFAFRPIFISLTRIFISNILTFHTIRIDKN